MKPSKRIVYIYGLWDPRDSRLRYIGKTVALKARFRRHLKDYDRGKITHCATWIKGILNDGLEPLMEVLEETNEEDWQDIERDWIAQARKFGVDLTNMVDGGTGGAVRGRKLSQAARANLSKALKGRPGTRNGAVLSEETKKKIGDANRGNKPRLGHKNTPEQNAKIGAANAIALKGKKVSEKVRRSLRKASASRWSKKGEKKRWRKLTSNRPRDEKG